MPNEGNAYGLAYDPDTRSCPATPLTLFWYIRDHGLSIPEQGILHIPLIVTLCICDGGILGEEEETEFVSLGVAWEKITRVIDRLGAVLGK